jgi:hypothetical protein
VKLGLLTLEEEHRLRVFDNRALRRIFEPKRDEGVRGRRKLRIGELHKLCFSRMIRMIKSRSTKWLGHVALMGKNRTLYRILVRRLEGKGPLVRPRRMLEDNIEMDP